MMEVELVTHKGCPICVVTERTLNSKENVSVIVHGEDDPESQIIINKSHFQAYPILVVNGEYFAGNDALQKAKSL